MTSFILNSLWLTSRGSWAIALTITPQATCPSVLLSCTQWSSSCSFFQERENSWGIDGSWILNICLNSFLKCFCFSSYPSLKSPEVTALLYMPPGPSQRAVTVCDGSSPEHGLSVFLCSTYIQVKVKPTLEMGVFSHTEVVSVVIHHRVGWCKWWQVFDLVSSPPSLLSKVTEHS